MTQFKPIVSMAFKANGEIERTVHDPEALQKLRGSKDRHDRMEKEWEEAIAHNGPKGTTFSHRLSEVYGRHSV